MINYSAEITVQPKVSQAIAVEHCLRYHQNLARRTASPQNLEGAFTLPATMVNGRARTEILRNF